MPVTYDRTIAMVNSVNEADIWILPKTEENLKTTLWGTATAGKMQLHESREVQLEAPADNGLYIFRMIDTDKMYYSAEDIVIEAGDRVCQLAIREAPQIKWKVVTYLSETERAGNGFGSSGNK